MTLAYTNQSDLEDRSDKKNFILLALNQNKFPPTNNFEIESQLDGLDEKFRVYGKDNLANALVDRRSRLAKFNKKWTPEILHLLLELSYRPVFNSKLESLELLKKSQSDTVNTLRWSLIALEDPPLRENDVWENVNFADESTDDEYELLDSKPKEEENEIPLISSSDADIQIQSRSYAVETIDREGLMRLRDAQFWQKIPNIHGVKFETVKKSITESQAIREVLFMFGGYPTSLFKLDPQSSPIIEALEDYALEHVSHDSFFSFLGSLAVQGSAIMTLRHWAKRPQTIPLHQAFQLAILERLDLFDKKLSNIHLRFTAPANNVVVSLLSIQKEIQPLIRPLTYLANITKKIDKDTYGHAFRYLEMLYDLICTSQMAGDDEVYAFFGKFFFECFHVYLRPIKIWIDEGEIKKDDTTFFVCETSGDIELPRLWESRFKIRKTQDGNLHTPRFLRPAVNRIFNTGKSIVVLKHLNHFEKLKSIKKIPEPKLDFDTVCDTAVFQLAPFQELFDTAFDAWAFSKHQFAASILKETLFHSCGLRASLNALSHIYLHSDGSISSRFAHAIFKNLDILKTSWNDRFTVTEYAQRFFASVPSVSPELLHSSVSKSAHKYHDVEKCRKNVKALKVIQLRYQLSWPLQIVITPESMFSYQRIFTFLLQIRRCSYVLSYQHTKVNKLNKHCSNEEQILYYSLRMRIFWFTQTIYYYLTSLVLDPCSKEMQERLKVAEDVDMMIQAHSDYMKNCIDLTLLGSSLELIHKTVIKILNLGIKLEDTQATNIAINKNMTEEQQNLMDLSIASLGLQTGQRFERSREYNSRIYAKNKSETSSSDEHSQLDVDFSFMSSYQDDSQLEYHAYDAQLRGMKSEFQRLLKFITHGLKGVARAAGGESARLWDTLGDMLEIGLKN